MKTYLIVAEFKVREVAGLVVYNAEPLCLVIGVEGAGGAREAMQEYMRQVGKAPPPAVFILYPLGTGFGPPYLWFDPETLATVDPAGWLIATGRLERLGPVEVKGKRK